MHKLAKGLKKKKKQKKGKKGAEEDEFDPEELERYRRERAEAQQRAAESGDPGAAESNADPAAAGSDEWKKFEALTAGVDSILKKSQGDLDRIKSTSFFQRKAPLEDPKLANAQNEPKKTKRWVGFDESGNPIGEKSPEEEEKKVIKDVSDGFVEVPDDDDDQEDSAEEDIFDTTYVDVLQNIDIQLAYIPESPTQEELGDDPFDTTSADKVLKTVDKRGNKLVSLGNAVEVLSGRIDHVSTCKISRPRKAQTQGDLLLGDFDFESEQSDSVLSTGITEPVNVEKTLLDDDSDLPDIPIDLTKLPPVLPRPVTPEVNGTNATFTADSDRVDISEFEVLREKTLLEEIPDLDDAEFDLSTVSETPLKLEEAEDPFSAKESEHNDFQSEIIEASFEAATFVDEEDPFDTTFAENLVPGKTELKFIEKELEDFPVSEVAISLTDPAGLSRDYETGKIKASDLQDGDIFDTDTSSILKTDLLGGSVTDLSQLVDQPIAPVEEITYVDPFDTSGVEELPPGKTELKFLEQELLGEVEKADSLSDDDFDPRESEPPVKTVPPRPGAPPNAAKPISTNFQVSFGDEDDVVVPRQGRKPSRPEELGLAAPTKSVAFDLPTPSQRPDLLKTSEEEKSIPSKPLTPYSQRSFEEDVPEDEGDDEIEVDPFDTSFVAKVAPGKKELKLIESELLKRDSQLSHSLSDHDFNPRAEVNQGRRFSDFSATSVRPKSLKIVGVTDSLIEESEGQQKSVFEVNIEAHKKPAEPKRQESLLDADFEVDAKPLTPRIEPRSATIEEDISYVDPFDTSIAVNILPGKAELKILESELRQLPEQTSSKQLSNDQNFDPRLSDEEDFDPRAGEPAKVQDFLSLAGQDTGVKVLTPFQQKEFLQEEDIDPFDTSFATIGPDIKEFKKSINMDSKGGNPFLMDDYADEGDAAGNQQASNPFLQDFGSTASSGGGENPFLNFGADTGYQPPSTIDSTNPFASFGVETTAPSSLFGVETSSTTTFSMDMQSGDMFSGEDTNLFGELNLGQQEQPQEQQSQEQQQQEANLFGSPKETSKPLPEIGAFTESDELSKQALDQKNGKPPPMRPPPPRPHPPKNTKDLILSVTGAMDATSNHLLDRLQATRTPSPTLMHSPSPTPEHSFADLLDVDGNVPDLAQDDGKPSETMKNNDIMDLFDAPNLEDVPCSTSDMIFSAPKTETTLFSSTETSFFTGVTSAQENPFGDLEAEVPQGDAIHASDYPTESAATVVEKRLSTSSETPFSANSSFSAPEVTRASTTGFSSTSETTFSDTIGAQITNSTFSTLGQAPAMFTAAETDAAQPSTGSFASSTATTFGMDEPLYTAAVPEVGSTSTPFSTHEETPAYASDLLGDFSQPTQEPSLISTSPEPASEFPTSGVYQTDSLGDFSATAKVIESTGDAFDAFASKFDKAAEPEPPADSFFDAFGAGQTAMDTSSDVWGDSSVAGSETATGFGENEGFDSFLSMTAPPQDNKPKRSESLDSDEAPDFSIFIKPKEGDQLAATEGGPVPVIAPPPRSPQNSAYADSSPRFNPFDKSAGSAPEATLELDTTQTAEMTRTDSQETPPTPLFDEDVSQPLEDFPRVTYTGDGWEMQLRQPNKKKITGQRFWKKIFVKLVYQGDNPVLQLFNGKDDKDPFQELPLQACYSVSDIGAQQFDQYGKIFTVKLQYIFYKERPGVRPGQVTKAERITNKLSQFAAYAIQGDYQGVKEFGSDLKKLGLPVEHAPQISQLFKIGSQCFEDMKMFSNAVEEALFRLPAHRDRALNYKMEEVQITVVDELYVEQSAEGHVDKQIARVRLFFLGFLSGMPDVELGINDMWRQGKEVVGRHDIIPVVTEEWIRLENVEFHSCVQQDEYERSRIIKFKPPDACYIELMRFRVRPPKNRELPLQLKAVMCVTGNKVELRADILVPGFASRKLGQVPCEDVMVRFPIPECWIYLFRVEKHFRYGSVKSAHRRTGKIKGIERFLGAVDTLEPQLMEVTSGQAKYEHQHRAIVWRMPRLPKEGQGAYTTHQLVCRMALTSYDQIPEQLAEYCYVEFTMPATQVSHTTARSVSLQNSDSDNPPEKYVRNLSRHEYRVGIEHTQGEGPGAYVTATLSKKIPEATPEVHNEFPEPPAESDSDSSD